MKKRMIVFDLDGVIINTHELTEVFIRERYPALGYHGEKELLCGNFHEELAKFKQRDDFTETKTQEEIQALRDWHTEAKLQCGLHAGMGELIQKLKAAGYILTISTSAARHNAVPPLERCGVSALFDFIGTAEISKSKVEKFKIMKEMFGTETEDMLFITDTLGDLREAQTAGVATEAITWGAHDESYFTRKAYAVLKKIAHSTAELEGYIFEHF